VSLRSKEDAEQGRRLEVIVYNQQIGHTTSEAKSVPRARTLSSRAAC
jgi:hypothetical protein